MGRKAIVISLDLLRAAHAALLDGSTWAAESRKLGVAPGTLRARLVEAGLGVEVRKIAVGAGGKS